MDAWETIFLRLWYCQHIERISQRFEWIFLTKVILNLHQYLEYQNSIAIEGFQRIQFNVVEDEIQFNVVEDEIQFNVVEDKIQFNVVEDRTSDANPYQP